MLEQQQSSSLPEQLASCPVYDLSSAQAYSNPTFVSEETVSLHRLPLLGVDLLCDGLFLQGYRCGCTHSRTYGAGRLLLTDYEFKALMRPLCPFSFNDHHSDNWRRGFILGWVFSWGEQHVMSAPSQAHYAEEGHAHV